MKFEPHMIVPHGTIPRVRFAPSPTGFLHIGSLRTALYNYLFAKRYKGTFVLRIEDTDQPRTVPGALENIVRTFTAMDMVPDEGPYLDATGTIGERGSYGPYIQSKRLHIYTEHAHRLVGMGAAYYCVCTPERLESMRQTQMAAKQPTRYDQHCRTLNITREDAATKRATVRLAVPEGKTVTYHDLIHGEIRVATAQIDDQVLLKSDGFPTYHLAVVVDDHLMEISHTIRADDWLPSTPKHVLLYEAFGWKEPTFAHLPLLLNPDRSKLSKRMADVATEDYLKKGVLPEAMFNFIALLGWNPTADREIYARNELMELFDLTKVNPSGVVVNTEKLDWMNGYYLRTKTAEEFATLALPYLIEAGLLVARDKVEQGVRTRAYFAPKKIAPVAEFSWQWIVGILRLEQERVKRLGEIPDAVQFFFKEPQYDPKILRWKTMTHDAVAERLTFLVQLVQELPDGTWEASALERDMKAALAKQGIPLGEALWPMRVALSGRMASPPPFDIAERLGKQRTLARLTHAINLISSSHHK